MKERRRQKKRKSRDLSNRSLKTDGVTDSTEPTQSSFERERGTQAKSKSRDLSNRSLRQMGRQRVENLHRDRYQKDIAEDRRGDKEWRSYIGIS